jgi:hypothetical protein
VSDATEGRGELIAGAGLLGVALAAVVVQVLVLQAGYVAPGVVVVTLGCAASGLGLLGKGLFRLVRSGSPRVRGALLGFVVAVAVTIGAVVLVLRGSAPAVLDHEGQRIYGVAFAGPRIATRIDNEAWLWSGPGKVEGKLSTRSPAFSIAPDGKTCVTTERGVVQVRACPGGATLREITVPVPMTGSEVTHLAIAHRSDRVAILRGGTLAVANLSDGEVLWSKAGCSNLLACEWSPRDERLAVLHAPGVEVVDAQDGASTGEPVARGATDGLGVVNFDRIAWAPSGDRFAVPVHGTLHVFKPGDANPVFATKIDGATIHHVAWSPRGDRIAAAGAERVFLLSPTGQLISDATFGGERNFVTALAYAADGTLAAGCQDGKVRLLR